METLFSLIYWTLCLVGMGLAFASAHFMRQRNKTTSLALKHHSELMMTLCFCMAIIIAFLVTAPYIFPLEVK